MIRISVKTITILLWLSFTSLLMSQDEISILTYAFIDNGGTTINSSTLDFAKDILQDITFFIRYSIDRVTVPPIRGISAAPSPVDAITGASRPVSDDKPASESYIKDRNEITAAVNLKNIGFNYYYSTEEDYLAQMATISANFDFYQKNTNFAIRYSYGWDKIEPLGAVKKYSKTAHNANITLTQTLSPKTIGRVGVDFSNISGFQSNPYRSVNAGGQILLENHPRKRLRGAVFLMLNQYFETQTSLNMEYRYYRDDWEIQSHTIGFFYHQYISDNVLIRYRYRYYNQTAAKFYKPVYPTVQNYITSDYKLEAFNANLFGVKIAYKLEDLVKDGYLSFLSSATFEAKYERYFTSKDFIADIFHFGLVFYY